MLTGQPSPLFLNSPGPSPTSSQLYRDGVSPSSGSSNSANLDTPSPGRKRDFYFAGVLLGEVCTHSGLPYFSPNGIRWIQQQTGEMPSFPQPPQAHETGMQDNLVSSQPTDIQLPPRRSVEEYVSMFCKTSIGLVFPVLEPTSFWHTLGLAYGESQGSWQQIQCAKACVLSFTSLTVFSLGKWDSNLLDSAEYSAKVRLLLPQLFGDASVTTLQTVAIQSLYHLWSGNLQLASSFHTMACRIMFTFKAHSQLPTLNAHASDGTSQPDHYVRRMFWLLYLLDKEIALRTDLPPSIDDDLCNLELPPDTNSHPRERLATETNKTPSLNLHLSLVIIKSKALKYLSPDISPQKNNAELIKCIRELDQELETWRLSITERYRPSLSRSASHDLDVEDPILRMECIMVNLEYRHLVSYIHQATQRCPRKSSGTYYQPTDAETLAIASSQSLAVEAGRSTLVYLCGIAPALVGEPFWLILAHSMTAMLTLFCNILLNPVASQAKDDLMLLQNVPELIQSIHMRQWSVKAVEFRQRSSDLLAEMARIGTVAIQRQNLPRGAYSGT
ncbi:hypothetical protein PFICI_08879 [Pestalotiopsis fici W106-1]|uniref:Xylanolytic transcriptional activator regulatory domain-containing protein n=1 Tax=Pestalotiopsis fici (strain W106-1 / CGMCC3.15140) TaxID=1229662 RepID=W3X1H9_PESFW|nr:uncharacterized protein PFICI_08879 [Pestalotiopsis fici W106-1]ETS79026.1 hypothetical protein PFICI_08879 [Pestalotiopsis fici W106-1]